MRQPTSVLVYLVKQTAGRWQYLLLHRNPNAALGLPSFWQGVTGALEESETLEQAANRELAEETALVTAKLERVDYSYSFPIQDQWRKLYAHGIEWIVEHVFIAHVDPHQDPTLSLEHDRWQWCTADEALERLTYPENVEALKRCRKILESRRIET